MNKKEAKREACVLAAGIVSAAVVQGVLIGEQEHFSRSSADIQRIQEALEELIEELTRRGAGKAVRS